MSALPTMGDADRCLAVDERGNLVDGDLILYVCGTYLHKPWPRRWHRCPHGHERTSVCSRPSIVQI